MKNKKKICLVGGLGFIGHNLALELHNSHHEVSIIDNLIVNNFMSFVNSNKVNRDLYLSILQSRLDKINDKKIKFFKQDATKTTSILRILDKEKPDIIIHLSAVSHAKEANLNPHLAFVNSLESLETCLEYSRLNNSHLIYFSSSMVYGNFVKQKVHEKDNCEPLNIYGDFKLFGEKLIKSYKKYYNFDYTIIRPSALYGERCVSRRVGQIFIENALSSLPIVINGNPNDRLDFTYIDDLTTGVKLCCENEKSKNETFNLTSGESRSIQDLIDVLTSEFNNIKINYEKRDAIMPLRGTLSVDKAKQILGYHPKNSIEIGYIKYIKWYREFWTKFSS